MRSPYQILVFPFFRDGKTFKYCIFKRRDLGFWQGIAGGGEEGETPLESAKRESLEEAGIPKESTFIKLNSCSSIPVTAIRGFIWGEKTLAIPEYTFGVELASPRIILSDEHFSYNWFPYYVAEKRLKWDSNKIALKELNDRLIEKTIGDDK